MSSGRSESAAAIAQLLRRGEVVLLATDTLPGLHCRFDDAAALALLSGLKGRPVGKPLVILAGSMTQVAMVTAPLGIAQRAVCERYWPGPFSFIMAANERVPDPVTGGRQTVAVRVPACDALRELILDIGVPVVSTSANRAGQPPAVTMAAAVAGFGDVVAGFWEPGPPEVAGSIPSALVDLTVAPFRVLRPGPVAFMPD